MADILARTRLLIGTAAEWAANDLILGDGELVIERPPTPGGVPRMKVGNGLRRYSELPFAGGSGGGGGVESVNGETGIVELVALDIPIEDLADLFTATSVEGALQEVPGMIAEAVAEAAADAGSAGGAIAEWNYIDTTTPPPNSGNFRLNTANQTLATTLWLNVTTAMSVDVTRYLATIEAGDRLLIQQKGDSTKWQQYLLTATPTNNGTYFTFPVAWQQGGTPLPQQRCVVWHLTGGGGGSREEVIGHLACSDRTTALAIASNVASFRAPFPFTLTELRASLKDASSAGAVQVDVNLSGASVFSTTLSIDQGAKTSTTAATPAVISDTTVADDEEFTIDIDSAGTNAKGLVVAIIGQRL